MSAKESNIHAGCLAHDHSALHAFADWTPRWREGLVVRDRRSMLKASLAGIAGLSVPNLLQTQSQMAQAGTPTPRTKSVILLWMTGGPSHIDTWDVKPDAPREIRGPFGTIETKLPGVRLCEYYPKQAAMLDRFTIIRSVDCRFSNHEPTHVLQTANREADPRTNREGGNYPAIGSLVAKMYGANDHRLPPYVVLNLKDRSHVAWGGYLGKQYDPFKGSDGSVFQLPGSLDSSAMRDRNLLRTELDRLQESIDASGSMEAMDRFGVQAIEMVTGRRAQEAFDLAREPASVRDRYGEHPWCQQALLARRLVEAGVSYVTIDLSNHTSSGTWDTHGDNIPPYGGIWSGLRPLLPIFDHLFTTLVTDLEERGLIDDVLVLAMGEFGRTPQLGTQESTDGRNHWPVVMSMAVAGGGLRHGQVIGASERDGGHIKERPVTPGDIAATIYRHFGVPLDATYPDFRGRPRYILDEGQPIPELIV